MTRKMGHRRSLQVTRFCHWMWMVYARRHSPVSLFMHEIELSPLLLNFRARTISLGILHPYQTQQRETSKLLKKHDFTVNIPLPTWRDIHIPPRMSSCALQTRLSHVTYSSHIKFSCTLLLYPILIHHASPKLFSQNSSIQTSEKFYHFGITKSTRKVWEEFVERSVKFAIQSLSRRNRGGTLMKRRGWDLVEKQIGHALERWGRKNLENISL
jgi:hypothetical protein